MKILYGIQGTGNGHISRSRVLARALKAQGINVDYIFSGRDKNGYFDMEDFGDYQTFKGMSFATFEGRIDFSETIKQAHILKLLKDVHRLDVSTYDLVLNDFEPISAWAAKLQHIPSMAISNQATYHYLSSNLITNSLMKVYAPTKYKLGLYLYHFNQPVLPPIVAPELLHAKISTNGTILTYLPFESLSEIKTLLMQFPAQSFICYHPEIKEETQESNISFKKYSCEHFAHDLKNCNGIISNAGFSLISEALVLGKKLLVKPLKGQFEQTDNANYLKQLGLADIMETLSFKAIEQWLDKPCHEGIQYPDVATAIAKWILKGDFSSIDRLSKQLWEQTRFPDAVQQRIDKLNRK